MNSKIVALSEDAKTRGDLGYESRLYAIIGRYKVSQNIGDARTLTTMRANAGELADVFDIVLAEAGITRLPVVEPFRG